MMTMSMSSSGTSSGSSSLGTTTTTLSSSRSPEHDGVTKQQQSELQAQMENRRKRRKESNRESARRSRLRKQQHLDDLNSQVNQLKDQNKQLGAAVRVTSQNLVAVQAQNSVLQTQKMELDSRLASLTEILFYMNAAGTTTTTPSSASAVNPAGIMNHNNSILTPTSGACDVPLAHLAGASTCWSQQQPVDSYSSSYPCF